jgi:hypothetical protein
MVFNATFNNISVISWWSDLLVEETAVPGDRLGVNYFQIYVIDYITITLQFSWLHYITITSIFKCNWLNYNYFVNVIDYITDYI